MKKRLAAFAGTVLDRREKERLHLEVLGRYLKTIERFRVLHHIQCKCANGHEWDSAIATIWCVVPECPECHGAALSMKGAWYRPFSNEPNAGVHTPSEAR